MSFREHFDEQLDSRFDTEALGVESNRTTATVTGLVLVNAVWWFLLLRGHVPMPGMMWLMEQGIPMAAPGAVEAAVAHVGTVTAVAKYFVMWGVMMWAMMYVAMARYGRDYANALSGSTPAVAATIVVFFAGYNLVWMLSAVVPLAFEFALPGGIYGVTKAHTPLVFGTVLVLTGFYQLSEFKQSFLRECCARVEPRDAGLREGLSHGLHHGVKCIIISFGVFFLLMPFFGEMNQFWMLAFTFVIAAERIPVWGEELADATGILCLIAGVVVLGLQPALPVAF
ncbi:DUF2182 domain-containing protein [Halospeciosus flavus]|uniref:DUF2182 domain-containing protein n=1 Tax=Halospeciosus flavus TaxID=3032283 RepID=A0ABD5Z564_9EURY|nr:DUF2182 domain-containing protein [Halospeciosus flavus]